MLKLLVNVTKDNIKDGKCGSPTSCAVALAVANKLHAEGISFKSVSVDNEIEIRRHKNRCDLVGSMPVRVEKFITKFDSNKSLVKPMSFSINFIKKD